MRRMRFSPRSSFARTLLLIVTLLFVSLVTTYLVVLNFAILPSLQQFNKVLAYEVRMLMTDKLQLEDGTQLVVPPAFRREIYRELGISLYSNEAAEDAGLRWAQHYEFLSQQMAQQLGGPTEVRVEVNKSSPVVWLKTWLSPNIWVRVPLTEIHQGDFSPLFRYTLAIMLLAIGGAWLFIRIQNRPLVDLEHAALQVGKGIIPPPLREYGASEVRSVTRAFNHMAAGVKQLADWTADAEPFGRAEQYGEHEQQEAQTITTVGWIVFADAGDGAYAGAERARNREQDLLPQRLRFEVKLGLDLGFAIMGRPVVFGFTGFGAVGGCCSCHIGSDSTSTGVHGW